MQDPQHAQNCHQREYDTWRQTGMSRMLREYWPENLMGDFSPGTKFRDESGAVVIRMGIDKRPYFEFNHGGNWNRFYVDYTIGSKRQQGYATRLPDGSFHVFPIEYNALRKSWINYWKIIDPPGSERAIISDFPKMLPATNISRIARFATRASCAQAKFWRTRWNTAVSRSPASIARCAMARRPGT